MIRRNFRIRRNIEIDSPSVKAVAMDFTTAIAVFKDEYMRDDWSQRTLNFHLKNMAVFIKFLEMTTSVTGIGLIDHNVLEGCVRSMRHAEQKKIQLTEELKHCVYFSGSFMNRAASHLILPRH